MKPTDQTRFGASGNCLAACFASIAEVPLAEVDFSCSDVADGEWLNYANEKLRPFGLGYVDIKIWRDSEGRHVFGMPEGTFFVGSGPTGRGDFPHAVVCQFRNRRWTMIHDPHPSRAGIVELTHAGLLIKTGRVEALEKERKAS